MLNTVILAKLLTLPGPLLFSLIWVIVKVKWHLFIHLTNNHCTLTVPLLGATKRSMNGIYQLVEESDNEQSKCCVSISEGGKC